MASPQQNEAVLSQFMSEFALFQSNTKTPSQLTKAQRKEITDVLFPTGVMLHVDNPDIIVGDTVYGVKTGINDDNYFQGVVLTFPFTEDSHIDFKIMT